MKQNRDFKKSISALIYIIISFLFILSGLLVLFLAAIPLLILRILFYLSGKVRKRKLSTMDFSEGVKKSSENRISDMLPIFSTLIPDDAKSCLDIGSDRTQAEPYLKRFFDKYITLDIYNADITQDLNLNPRIRLKDSSLDIVIISNILEHLVEPLPTALEANRIAKKYILIGLPNEYTLDKRLFFLFGLNEDRIYPWGHKHRFSLKLSEALITFLWGSYALKKYKFGITGGNFIPKFMKKILLNLCPSLFAAEVFYLVNKKNINKKLVLEDKNLVEIYPESFVKEISHLKRFRQIWQSK